MPITSTLSMPVSLLAAALTAIAISACAPTSSMKRSQVNPDVGEDNVYVVETNFYDVATEKLIWTGISETLNPKSSFEGVDSVGKVIITTLR